MTETKKMGWFRCYAEAVDDEKLRLLSFEDRWHFIALLCCKSSGIIDEGGPLLRRKLAVKLGLDLPTFDEVVRRLSEVELIDRQTIQPIAWNRRQFQSDTSTERVREYRERMKQARNASVTPPETDTDTETEAEEEREGSETTTTARDAAKRSPNGSRLPDDFPAADDIAWCKQNRPDLDPVLVLEKFRDYWLGVPGAKGRKVDWPATWRNFVRGEREVRRAPAAPPSFIFPRTASDRNAAAIAGLTGRNRPHQSEVIDVTPTILG